MTDDLFEQARTLHHSGDLERAAELYRQTIASAPDHFRALNNLGAALESLGRVDEAEAVFARALEVEPDAAFTHYNLGRLAHLAGHLDQAEPRYRRAIELEPDFYEAHFNLGRLLQESERSAEAVAPLRAATALEPDSLPAVSLLGDALFEQRQLVEALEVYRHAAALEPAVGVAHFDMGRTLETLQRANEAIDCYRRSLECDPSSDAAREAIARAMDSAGQRDEAIRFLRAWLDATPGQPIASHLLASLGGDAAPARASDAYVRITFDRFAHDFDTTLHRLGYRAPQVVAEALATLGLAPDGSLAVLDAGCGTGLCAPLLKPWAAHLVGVDLSAGMIERARRLALYDELVEAELGAFLRERPGTFDVIASADTLCYFGALDDVLAAASAALRTGGALAFTVERLPDDAPEDAQLSSHGRYGHRAAYVERAIAGAGLTLHACAPATLRMEGGAPVEGLVVTAVRTR